MAPSPNRTMSSCRPPISRCKACGNCCPGGLHSFDERTQAGFHALDARCIVHDRRGQHERNAFQTRSRPLDQACPIGGGDGRCRMLPVVRLTDDCPVGNAPHPRGEAGQASHYGVECDVGIDAVTHETVQAFQIGDDDLRLALHFRHQIAIGPGPGEIRDAAGERRRPVIQLDRPWPAGACACLQAQSPAQLPPASGSAPTTARRRSGRANSSRRSGGSLRANRVTVRMATPLCMIANSPTRASPIKMVSATLLR